MALVATVEGLDVIRLSPTLGGVGVRYRIADQTVLGTSLGLRVATDDGGSEGGGSDREDDQDFFDATLSVWVEQHVGRRRRAVSPFVGAGVQVGGGTADFVSDEVSFRASRRRTASRSCGRLRTSARRSASGPR